MSTQSEASQAANRAGLDPKRLVVIFYLAFGFIFALFLEHVLSLAWGPLGLSNPELIEGLGWKVTTVVAVLLSIGGVVAAFVHPKLRSLSLEVASELMKVTWPSWSETKVSTMAVVVASLVAAAILYTIDLIALHLMVDWLPALWGKL
jgi:preprotein translocase subunit SecE